VKLRSSSDNRKGNIKEKTRVKTVLIAPPHFYLFNTLGVPQLTGYLKAKGRDVEQILVDTDLYTFLLSPAELELLFLKIKTEILPKAAAEPPFRKELEDRISEHDGIRDILLQFGFLKGSEDILTILEVLLAAKDTVIDLCADAVAQIESKFVNLGYEAFLQKLGLMTFGMQIISLANFPSKIDLIEGIQMRYSPMSVEDILKAVGDRDENFLLTYYEKRLYPRLVRSGAGVIGIQINHDNQLISAFTIMDWVRKHMPTAFIIIGGTWVSYLREQIANEPQLWSFFDGIGAGMGEYTLDTLIHCLEQGLPLSTVPNLTYREKGKILVTHSVQVDMATVAAPEFPESRPTPILPYITSVGCYWGKCAFCDYVHHHMCSDKVDGKSGYYAKSERKVVDDLKALKVKYNPFFFFFCDSDIPPARLERIADLILAEDLEISFFIWIRAEKEFLSYALCEKLVKAGVFGVYIGLEAGCQRINDLMNKGIEVKDVETIIRNFHRAGIICNLFSIVGTPTETQDEAWQTREFFKRNLPYIRGTISIAAFHLSAYSRISAIPQKYGVTKIIKPDKGTLALTYDYEVEAGLTQRESLALRDWFEGELGVKYLSYKFLLEYLRRKYPIPVVLVQH
jgi:anaerobic magnesium-protoporphyrin IX monomethyl ester cyclase